MSYPSKPRKKSPPKKSPNFSMAHREASRQRMLDPVYRAKLDAGREKMKRENPQLLYRYGIPDGMRRKEALVLWAKAEEQARKFIKLMEDMGELPEIVVPGSEEEMAKEALREAYRMAVSPLTTAQTKTGYIRTVLEWTKAKPESKSKLTLDKSEEWLAALKADMENDGK